MSKTQQRREVAMEEDDEIVEGLGDATFRLVDDLQSVGINVTDIKKLQEGGINTIGQILQRTTKQLEEIKGITEAKIAKIREAAKKLDPRGNSPFKSGLEMQEKRKQVIKITTGCEALDRILGGGVETASITELFGEFRTGKTQLCHTLCVTSQLSFQMKGGQGKVIYLDTEGNFRPERITAICERFGLNINETLDNIIVCRVFSHEEQMNVIKPIAGLLADPAQGPFRLLIIDSIIALFRVEFSGRGELADRQQRLGQHLSHITRLAEEFNIACLIINQCMSDPGQSLSIGPPPAKPVGGHVLAHSSTTRVQLKKGKENLRIAKIYDSPLMPEEEATFAITNGGIDDPTG